MSQYDAVRTKLQHASMHINKLKDEEGVGHVTDVLTDLHDAVAKIYDIVESLVEA